MQLSYRRWSVLCLGGLAAVLAACTSPGATQCEVTGVLCPVGTHCAAAEPVCISDLNLCGNAKVDPGEVCDDGNTRDGDGCSADCKSTEACGNNIVDVRAHTPEVCDDGNTRDGDGCSHDCLSLEKCGNGIKDIGEACDDGNTNDGDGCSHDCKSTESCGNGIVDSAIGEVCDPPHAGTCSPDCRSLLTCGNGKIDPGEECDDGQGNNGDDKDCRKDCVINRCGDGFANTHLDITGHRREECDGAPQAAANSRAISPTETSGCNIDCSSAKCGDGKVNRHFTPPGAVGPEQCDNVDGSGNSINADNDDCTATCQINVCGDGHRDTVGARKEDCDDGNRNDNDACTNQCKVAGCGDGILGPGEDCDDGPGNNGAGKRCNSACKFNVCGDGDRLIGVEQCDDGIGGVPKDSATCDTDCTFPVCGDGHKNTLAGEGCDDGANNGQPGDTCSTTCHPVSCGNGFLEQGEECDDGMANNGSGKRCNANCKLNVCGDGDTLSGVEQCDDGAGGVKQDSTTCDADCTFAVCGDGHKNTMASEACDDGANNGNLGDPCSTTCHLVTCGNGFLEQGEQCDDGMTNNGPGKRCNASCKLNVCGDGDALAGVEQCDDGAGGVQKDSATCDADCTFAVCGDGHKNTMAGEGCDDGASNGTPGDTCSLTCHLVACGNGSVEQGEACDDGNTLACGTCSADCGTFAAAAPATGLIFAAPGSEYAMAGTDNFTLDDGLTTKSFKFSTAATPGFIKIDPSGAGADSNQMAQRIATAISASGLRIDAQQVGATGIVSLTNRQPTASGNKATTNNVTAASFFLSTTMAGGKAGDCPSTTRCAADDDCLSNRCDVSVSPHTCKACSSAGDCATNLCVSGQCQVCANDGECAAGQHCTAGTCQ